MAADYSTEIADLRQEYLAAGSNPDKIRAWLQKYPHVNAHDLAAAADRSTNTVRRWRRLLKIGCVPPPVIPSYAPVPRFTTFNVPEELTDDWLREQLKTHSAHSLQKALHISFGQFKKRGIATKTVKESTKSRNPHCTREWVWQHYVHDRLTHLRCAKLAGISRQTFQTWLRRFNIPIRTRRESRAKVAPQLWLRRITLSLQNCSIVKRVRLSRGFLQVQYQTKTYERFYFQKDVRPSQRYYFITKADSRPLSPLQIVNEYPSILGEQFPAHLTIGRGAWEKAGVLDQRIAAQKLVYFLVQRGWLPLHYPAGVLRAEWEAFQKAGQANRFKDKRLDVYRLASFRKHTEHYFDLSEFAPAMANEKLVLKSLNALLARAKPINTSGVLWEMSRNRKDLPQFTSALAYQQILKKLRIAGPLLDLSPGYGAKALACASLGIHYCPAGDNGASLVAISQGFGEAIGLRLGQMSDAEAVIADERQQETDWEQLLAYRGGRTLIGFCRAGLLDSVIKRHAPSQILELGLAEFHRPDAVVVFR